MKKLIVLILDPEEKNPSVAQMTEATVILKKHRYIPTWFSVLKSKVEMFPISKTVTIRSVR